MIQHLIEKRFGPDAFSAERETVQDEPNPVIENLLNHTVSRKFTDQPVTSKLLNLLFAAAFSAPSKSDLQQVSVIHLTDRRKIEHLADHNPKVAWIVNAPVFLVWCADSRRIRQVCKWKQHPFANDHLDAFMNAAVDVGIVMEAFISAAESMGLGCCPISEIRDDIHRLSTTLALPKYVFPVAGFCLGWPAEQTSLSMRLPPSVTIHENVYDDSNMIEAIDHYDRAREADQPTPIEKQRSVEQFGLCETYSWSEDRSRQYAQKCRANFGAYIRKQGFNLS